MSLTAGTQAISLSSGYRRLADFLELTKPRVSLMVLVTTCVGYYLGADPTPAQIQKAVRGARTPG